MIKRLFETYTEYESFYADNEKYTVPVEKFVHNSFIHKVLRKIINKKRGTHKYG